MDYNVVEIGDKKFNTKMLLVGDMETLHLKKSGIDYLRKNGDYKKAFETFNELLADMYPDVDEVYRQYVLIYNIISGEGKSKYKLQYKCDECSKTTVALLEIQTNDKLYYKEYDDLKIYFNYHNYYEIEKLVDIISHINYKGLELKWDRLNRSTQEIIFSYIDRDEYKEIFENTQMCRAIVRGHDKKCCDSGIYLPEVEYIYGGFNIFDILINSKNLTMIYQLNHQLLERGISLADQMNMKPFERNIYINMIIKKEQEEAKEYENRLSTR